MCILIQVYLSNYFSCIGNDGSVIIYTIVITNELLLVTDSLPIEPEAR